MADNDLGAGSRVGYLGRPAAVRPPQMGQGAGLGHAPHTTCHGLVPRPKVKVACMICFMSLGYIAISCYLGKPRAAARSSVEQVIRGVVVDFQVCDRN